MDCLLDSLPPPDPDIRNLTEALGRRRPARVPLFELAVADPVLAALAGSPVLPRPEPRAGPVLTAWARQRTGLWARLGFDYVVLRADTAFPHPRLAAAGAESPRAWVDEQGGPLQTRADLAGYPWPKAVGLAEAHALTAALPPGMGAVAFSGGVLEWTTNLMGLEPFLYKLHDEPELCRQVVDRVGAAILATFEALAGIEAVAALWLGDDLGFRTGTLIHPREIRRLLVPWYRRFAKLAHASGRPFILHSCGNIEAVMPDLIAAGIDARHSFEDAIVPVVEAQRRWGNRVAILGGIDVDLLCRATPREVADRTRATLEACAGGGGYAAGSGNSIPDYVPPENYLALVQEVHRFNRRC